MAALIARASTIFLRLDPLPPPEEGLVAAPHVAGRAAAHLSGGGGRPAMLRGAMSHGPSKNSVLFDLWRLLVVRT